MNCQKGCQAAAGGLPADTGKPIPAGQERVSSCIRRREKRAFAPLLVAVGRRISEEFSCPTAHKNCGILIGRSGFSGHVYAGRLCKLPGRFCRKGLPSALLWARPKEAGRQKTAQAASGGYGYRAVWFTHGRGFYKAFCGSRRRTNCPPPFLPLPADPAPLILLCPCGIL